MGYVRPFVEEDILQVADLHRRVFHTGDASSHQLRQSYRSYFARIFLHNPWRDPAQPSLVYQETNGKIVGFLGVLPRPMAMNGRPIRAVVSSQFIVDPARRSTLAGLQLLKAFFAGPQDLSITDEANAVSQKLWEAHGGTTSLLYSLYWLRLLQPTQFLSHRMLPSALTRVFSPLCRLADAIIARVPLSPFRQSESGVFGEELSCETLFSCLSKFSLGWSLRPEYDNRSLGWLMDVLAHNATPGSLQKKAVYNEDRQLIGWYLYQLTPGGLGEVLQIGAEPNSMTTVLDHLFHHAWKQGATALSGRIEPRFVEQFWKTNSVYQYRGYRVLLHSKKPELLEAIQRGDAFLTRLEGEWCIRFQPKSEGGSAVPMPVSRQQKQSIQGLSR